MELATPDGRAAKPDHVTLFDEGTYARDFLGPLIDFQDVIWVDRYSFIESEYFLR